MLVAEKTYTIDFVKTTIIIWVVINNDHIKIKGEEIIIITIILIKDGRDDKRIISRLKRPLV